MSPPGRERAGVVPPAPPRRFRVCGTGLSDGPGFRPISMRRAARPAAVTADLTAGRGPRPGTAQPPPGSRSGRRSRVIRSASPRRQAAMRP